MDTIEIQNEELVKRHEIEETPFTIVETDGYFFATIGQYRITEPKDTLEECRDEVTKFTWNNITNLIITITEILKNQK
jgi:hypothetical protein